MDQILAMGFAEYQAKKALAEFGDNVEASIDYIMGHMDDSMSAVYREKISDERLQAVTDHIHQWL